jgi:hypothetical protein
MAVNMGGLSYKSKNRLRQEYANQQIFIKKLVDKMLSLS